MMEKLKTIANFIGIKINSLKRHDSSTNHTYEVNGEVFIKIQNGNLGNFINEQQVLKYLNSRTTLAPKLIATQDTFVNFGNTMYFSVIEKVGDVSLANAVSPENLFKLGRALRGFHQVEVGSISKNNQEYINWNLADIQKNCDAIFRSTGDPEFKNETPNKLMAYCHHHSNSLFHGDQKYQHAIFNKDGGLTFIDLECCYPGDPMRDIACFSESSDDLIHIMNGYGQLNPQENERLDVWTKYLMKQHQRVHSARQCVVSEPTTDGDPALPRSPSPAR